MEADIEKLMSSKSFKELTIQEREEWKDLFTTEEEYNQMQSMFAGLDAIREEKFEPSAKVKNSLDDLFAKTYGVEEKFVAAPTFWTKVFPQEKSFFQRPLVQVAAAVLLIVIAVPFLTRNSLDITNNNVQVAKEESVGATSSSPTIGPKTTSAGNGTVTAKNVLVSPPTVTDEVPSEDFFSMDENAGMIESISASPPPFASSHSDLDWEKEEETVGYTSTNVASVKSTNAAEQKGILDLLTVSF